MNRNTSRRELLAGALIAPAALSAARAVRDPQDELFSISLAQWSLHRTIRAGDLAPLDFPRFARDEFGIEAVEYVNQFFADKAGDFDWLGELKQRADDAGVRSLLIMVDGEGALAAADHADRRRAIERHFKWVAAARFLGCHAIRVNAAGEGEWGADRDRAADSLRRLADFGEDYGISVIVENHGGLSSNGAWLAEVMARADHPGVGTLPDFGNFHIGGGEWYDRYEGVQRLMPYAKAVSAKSHEFDDEGNEVFTDYRRMMRIVLDAGYAGHVGIEWEGGSPSEAEGVLLTQELLLRVREELAAEGR
jgi:sugar phosphate isomerase/epimerase